MVLKSGLLLFTLWVTLQVGSAQELIRRQLTDDQRFAFAMLRADYNYYPTCRPGYHGQPPRGQSPATILAEYQAISRAKKAIQDRQEKPQTSWMADDSLQTTPTKKAPKKSSGRVK